MKILKNYWKPTPIMWRKVGDSLLILSTSLGGYAAASGKAWGIVIMISGVLGKIITNCATTSNQQGNVGENVEGRV